MPLEAWLLFDVSRLLKPFQKQPASQLWHLLVPILVAAELQGLLPYLQLKWICLDEKALIGRDFSVSLLAV